MSTQPAAISFYWRPGCGFCTALDRSLTKRGIPLDRRNIWDDESHATFVRSVARGYETVPTVVVGDMPLVNPSTRQVISTMAEHTPHLLPEDVEVPEPGRLARFVTRMLGRDAA